jgi:hypothetical protein
VSFVPLLPLKASYKSNSSSDIESESHFIHISPKESTFIILYEAAVTKIIHYFS